MKVLLEMDIGSDIDDAICLAYLLAKPECELLGITTVSGEAYMRAILASVLYRVERKNISIYPGFEEPLTGFQKQRYASQAVAPSNWNYHRQFPRGQAIEFLRETIHKYPDEIILYGKHEVAVSVNAQRFFSEYFSVFRGPKKELLLSCSGEIGYNIKLSHKIPDRFQISLI